MGTTKYTIACQMNYFVQNLYFIPLESRGGVVNVEGDIRGGGVELKWRGQTMVDVIIISYA